VFANLTIHNLEEKEIGDHIICSGLGLSGTIILAHLTINTPRRGVIHRIAHE